MGDIRRKHDVEQNEVGSFPSGGAHRAGPIIGEQDIITVVVEFRRERFEDDAIVIHNQEFFTLHKSIWSFRLHSRRIDRINVLTASRIPAAPFHPKEMCRLYAVAVWALWGQE